MGSEPLTSQSEPPPGPWGVRVPPSEKPVAAFVLTVFGDFVFLPWAIGFFVSYVSMGELPLQFAALFVSSIGVLGCAIMMMARPRQHVIWGVVVLLFSLFAIAIDGYILVGLPFFIIPLGLILIGGILAITWKQKVQLAEPGRQLNRNSAT